MDSSNNVGPPRLLRSEVILPSGVFSENQHCVLKINVEDKSRNRENNQELNIRVPPNTLSTLLNTFGKIRTQLNLLTEKQTS